MIVESRSKDNKKIKVNAIDYEVYSDKDINCDDDEELNICLISDFHDLSPKRMLNVAKYIVSQKPDMIIIAGDILHSTKYRKKSEKEKNGSKGFSSLLELLKNLKEKKDSEGYNNLIDFLKIIMEVCPVYLGLGNHDLLCMKKEHMNAYLDLSSVGPNVHPLNNNVFYDEKNNIRTAEFHFEHDIYSPSWFESGKGAIAFAEAFLNTPEIHPTEDFKNSFNGLICHDGKLLAQARSIKTLEALHVPAKDIDKAVEFSHLIRGYDVIYSGHLHGGYAVTETIIRMIEKNPEKYVDNGIWEMPLEVNYEGKKTFVRFWIMKKTNMCRGTIYISDDLNKIVQLSNGKYYEVEDNFYHESGDYKEISEKEAIEDIMSKDRTTIATSGGLNPAFGLSIGMSEVTMIKVKKPKIVNLSDYLSRGVQMDFSGIKQEQEKRKTKKNSSVA